MLIYACKACGAQCWHVAVLTGGLCDCGEKTFNGRTWGHIDECELTCTVCAAAAQRMPDPYKHADVCSGKVGG